MAPAPSLSALAHHKALAHAAKFPWAAVTGLLLGPAAPDAKNSIVDAVPLFHTPALGPGLEVACMLVEEYCKTVNLRVVGLYAAEDKADGLAPSPLVERVASQLATKIKGGCCLLVVDNAALASEDKPAFIAFSQTGTEWRPSKTALEIEAGAAKGFTAKLKQGSTSIVDFDDHFADVSKDWRNSNF